jgi:hypothetical protein
MADKVEEVKYGVLQWGPCVVHLKISESFQEKLLKGAEEAKKNKKDYRPNLAGIIKEEYAYEDRDNYVPEISQFLGVYDQAFQKWKNQEYKQQPEYILNSLWVNYMKKSEYNPPHDHSDYLSFVIFLKVPEEIHKEQKEFVGNSGGPGSLSFLYGDGNRQSITYQSVLPKDRDIFIFPAWIKHYVAPFYSDVTRISVSGNIANSVELNNIKRNKDEGK